MDGRYHVTLFYIYMFKDLARVPELTVSLKHSIISKQTKFVIKDYKFTNARNKLERLSPASLSSLVKCLWVRPGAYP